MPLFGLRFSTHDEDERAQKNTFTRWINLHLEEHSSSGRVNDLFEDIKDGVLLCHLIEVLTGEALQVCRTRASKRVHHIANLTTALTVLRRRGLELVNNNASDIADGNPRIVLGLIWQIILHFQIESNMALLREWGWGSTSVQYSRESTPVRSSSPIKSRLASFLSSGPSTSAESPKVSVKHMKGSVEQVMLRWINSEIAQKLNMRVENMDRDWKDGVMFNALVHRWKPDVVDMEKVRATEPRENLENAFELAHKHLGISKLLEIDDVLCAKPDKRSIITYVSQFVRTYGKPAPVEEHNVHTEFLEWLAFTCKLDLRNNEQGMYFRVRREFIEYRSLYNTIMATKLNYTIEELSLIQERWEIIRNNLEATAVNAEKRLPKPYSSLSVWTATGQSIINTPLNLPTENPQKCLVILQKMISEHNRHFIDMAAKMEELNTAADSGGLGGRPVAAEYVEPLRIRMTTLADEAPLKLATLKILYAHYTLLAYLQEIESKMRLWSSAESLQLLNRWLTEYSQLEKENPRSKCSHYIEDLRKTLASEPNTKLDGDSMVRTCGRRAEEVLKAFDSMKTNLWTLRSLWAEWEQELERLDRIAMTGIGNRTNTLQDESEAIRLLEAKFDELAPLLSVSARLASNQRMELLRLKVKQLNKFGATTRLVVELVPSTSQIIRKVTNVNEAAASIQEIETNLNQRTSRGVENELQETCEKMELKRQLNALRKVKPQMNAIEHYLAQLQEWLASKDAYDRAKALDVLDLIGKAIDTIEADETGRYVDCESYRAMFRTCTSRVHGEGTSSTPQYEEPPIDKEYVREVMTRAELILDRKESTDDEIRASLNDMADCEVVLRDWNSKRLTALRERWEAKRREFELWQTQMDRVQQIAATLERSQGLDPSIIVELQRIEESCDQMLMTDLAHSLRLAVRRLRVLLETSYEERLESLKMSGEEDCTVAHNIVQEVGEELVAFCPQLNERHIEARQVLSRKMELFRRLQNYYDAVKYLRNQNISWNTITVAQVPSVSTELRTLLERCDTEWQNDASQLREELNGISGSFFELEFDRVNEKLNLLTYEKDKLRDLMRIRLEYLDAVRDFIASADSSIDINQMATPSDSPHVLQDRMKQLCSDLEEKAKHLKQLQDPAEMIISDLTIPQLIKKFRWQLMGPEDDNTFSDTAHRFENLISRPMPSSDDPQQFLTITLELMRSEESESKAFDEMNELAISESDRSERDRLAASFKNRQEQRKRLILNYLYSYHDYLNSLFRSYEDKVVQLINNREFSELHKFNDGEWKQWKESVGELESALDASMRLRLRPEFADLQRKAFSLDSKISRSIASSAKQKRHEEKLAMKLSQFETWLNAMEDDVNSVENMPSSEEQTYRLSQLLSSCLSHQRLVSKLERLNVQNRDHVLQLCQKYYNILNRLRRYNLEEGTLPLHVGTLVHGAQTESQLSISSLASSDFADRPESVQSVSSSIDIGSVGADSELPVERAIGDIRRKLHNIINSYNDGPKSLAAAIADYNLLLTYRGELNKLFDDLPPGSDAKNVALENSLHHLLEHLNETASKLQSEIDEEVSISAKEKEIVAELSRLEERVRSRNVSDLNVIYDLDQLQTQMDLLRMISSKPRQFVESDLMDRGGPTSNRSRQKRKVLMMVTNTVTTIIQVVEERLLTIEARSRDPVVQQKLDLVKTNLKKLEEEAIGSPPEEEIDIPTAGKSQELYLETEMPAKLSEISVPSSETFAAAVFGVEQALNIAEDIDLKSCNDPHVLSESLSILDRQSAAMDALCDTASELAKSGDVQYLRTITTLQERLLSVKHSLVERLEKLRLEEPGPSITTGMSTSEEPFVAPFDNFDSLVEDIRAATNSAEAVLSDKSCDSSMLLKARDDLKTREPVLSKLSDIASARARSGDAEGIDVVSMISEEFNSVQYAIEDRISEFVAQAADGSESVSQIGPTEGLPEAVLDDYDKLVEEIRTATYSADALLNENSSDTETLQKAVDKLRSQEPTLAKLSDIASTRALSGDAELIDIVSSVSEEFNGVLYAIQDRIDELKVPTPSAPAAELATVEWPAGSSSQFDKVVQDVLEATTSVELVLGEEISDVDVLLKAREKLKSQEPFVLQLSEVASVKARLGDCKEMDVVSSVSEQFKAMQCALEDRIGEFLAEETAQSATVPSTTAQEKAPRHDKSLSDVDEVAWDTSYDIYPELSGVLVSQLVGDSGEISTENAKITSSQSEFVPDAEDGSRESTERSLSQLQHEVEELEKVLSIALPSSSDLISLQQARIPKLLFKLDAISDVPVDLLSKKEDLSNRIDIINKKLDDQVHEMKEFEQKTVDLQNVVDECRDKLRIRDTPAPIDDVTKDEQDLSAILVAVDSIPQEDLSPRNQLARDVNNIKEQVKGRLATLRKALPDEMKARQQQNELKDRLSSITDALTRVDSENLESAKQQLASIDNELQKMSGVADAYQQFATSPSSVVSHDDLDKTLPEQVQKLQKECEEKKKDIEQIAQLKAVAPEILLISESLQQQPEEIPHNLNDQQTVLEELEAKKQRLENLIETIPAGEATEELRQRSAWDLSRLKDLLKRLGDSMGDKLAALATFNAVRKDAEDQLLMIATPDVDDKVPEDLKNDEECLQVLQQRVSQLDGSKLDDQQRDEHSNLLDRINRLLLVTKQRRSDLEKELARRAADEELRNTITPVSVRLVELVNDADRLLADPEGVPTQYRVTAEELINECRKAGELLRNAPANHPSVNFLESALSSAERVIPVLHERANIWNVFVQVRDDATKIMESVDASLPRLQPGAALLSTSEGEDLLNYLKEMYGDIQRLRTAEKQLNELALLLRPLLQPQQEIRFFTVDQENTEKHYEEIMERVATELTAEAQLNRTLEILTSELNQCSEELTSASGRKDRLSHESLLQDIIAHLENQKVIVERSAQCRQYIESNTSLSLDLLMQRAQELLETLRRTPPSTYEAAAEEYDVDAAADVLAALYPEAHPYSVLAEHGFEGIGSDTDSRSELESIGGSSSGLLSPLPETSTGPVAPSQFHRQRSRWRRVLRTALPLQAMLVLLLGAACLVPHCDDEYCCQLLNNFARSFDPSLEFINGPPPF